MSSTTLEEELPIKKMYTLVSDILLSQFITFTLVHIHVINDNQKSLPE